MKAVLVEQYIGDDLKRRIDRYLQTPWQVVAASTNDPLELYREVRDAEAIIGHRVDVELLGNTKKLKLVLCTGAGVDEIVIDAFPPGAVLCNVHEHQVPIAEYVLMGMLMCATGVMARDADLRQGRWTGSGRVYGAFHDELYGKTLGLIGLGRIGREVAARARAFGMRIVALRRVASEDVMLDACFGQDHRSDFFKQCDYVAITCPLTEQTRGMIGVTEIESMKPTAVLINPSRGEIVQEQPLYEALSQRTINAAVLDTWYQYPDFEESGHGSRFPFHELDNVVITPHFAAWTEAMVERRMKMIAENLDRFERGEALMNLVPTQTGTT